MRTLPSWISRSIFAVMVFGAPALTLLLIRAFGLGSGASVTAAVLLCGATLLGLEYFYPLYKEWSPKRETTQVDILHSLFSTPLPPLVIAAFGIGAAQEGAAYLGGEGLQNFWPHHWPIALQVFVALAISELGAYWIHRIGHVNRFFWRIHSLHHSPRGLHTLASSRNHPINVLAMYAARVLPIAALGASTEVLACMSILNGVHGMLQHTNLDIRAGWLNHVFAGPELHHRHHSLRIVDSRTNFGNILCLWDKIFGTWSLPRGERFGSGVGVYELDLPESYFSHLMLPFELGKWEKRSGYAPPRAGTLEDAQKLA